MKSLTSLAACVLSGTMLLGVARGDEPGTVVIHDGALPNGGYGYATDCPPGAYGSGHWDTHSYPGVPRVAGTIGYKAGVVGYAGLQKGYHVAKHGWRFLEGDPDYHGHWNHPHQVAQYGYGGAGGGNWGPQHRIFYTYHHPTDLRYPPPQVPAAIVQYPYYTNRGPTDFFMK